MNSFRRVFLLAIAIALMSCAAAEAQRVRVSVRGGGMRRHNNAAVAVSVNGGFAPSAVFVQQSFQPVFVQPTAIYAQPSGAFFFRSSGGCGCW